MPHHTTRTAVGRRAGRAITLRADAALKQSWPWLLWTPLAPLTPLTLDSGGRGRRAGRAIGT